MESISVSYLLHTLLAFLAFATVRSQNINSPPVIVESPQSLLAPVNMNAAFTCQAHCITSCSIYWIINGTTISDHIRRSNFEQQFGFFFSYQKSNMTYTVGLTIRASVNVNDTNLQCEVILNSGSHDEVKSSHAKLLVLTKSPIFPNPSILTQSDCTLLLQWSPPFLWPGHRIQHYDITVANMSNDSSIDLDMLNATFNDAIVSYVYHIHNIQSQMCHTELLFGVTATNNYAKILSTYYIEVQHPATLTRKFFNSSINISILFSTSLLTPIVSLSIQLPEPLCSLQEQNYTILISDVNGSIIAESGPYNQLGSELNMAGIAHHDVSSGLLRNEEYSLNVVVVTFACVSTSNSYYFDTNFKGDLTQEACEFHFNAQLSYQIATGVLLGTFLLVTFLALLVVLLKFIVSKNQYCSGMSSKTRSRQSMVHNPIYIGPDYESIHPQYETLQLVPQHVAHSTPGPECGN